MKKFFKILGIIFCIILAGLYVCFLFVLPRVVDISQFKPEIQKLVKEQANIDLSYNNEKLITTPLLGIGFSADDIKVTMPDKSDILTADKIKAVVSIPHALLLTVKVSSVDIENPIVNAEIMPNGEDYKIVKHIENILNAKKESTFGEKQVEVKEGFQFNPDWIKIVIPNVQLHNYKVLVRDLGSGHYLDLHGEKLIFGYFNNKNIRVRTNAELYSDKNKNITANIDFDTFLPPPSPKLDEEDDPAEKIDIPFINPVSIYQKYDLKANLESKIKIRHSDKKGIYSFGHLNIENITLKISEIKLPESYIKIKTFNQNATIDSDIYATKNENIKLAGKINYSKHPNADMYIKTGAIKFQDMLTLAEAFLKSLSVPNELNQYKAGGELIADCYIKTNFKKLKSNGYIKIQNGALQVRNLGEVLSKININVLLDNNILKLDNSHLFVGNSEVKIKGSIDEKSYTDVNITSDRIPLPKLYNAFAPKDLRNNFKLKAGDLSATFTIQGKMKEAVSNLKAKLNNLDFSDNNNSFAIKNYNFDTNFNFDAKTKNMNGEIQNKGLNIIFPKTSSKITIPKIEINIADKNIDITPNILYFNNNSAIGYLGSITNYEKLENIDFSANGEIKTPDLIKFLGNDIKPYLHYNGKIPVRLDFNGNKHKQTLYTYALGDTNNFITPIDFKNLQGQKTSLQANIDFKPKRIKIKNTGLFTRTIKQNEDGTENIKLNKVIDIDGTLEHNRINLLKLDIKNNLEGKIFVFPKSNFILDKTKIFAFGRTSAPIIRGDINLHDLIIPEIHSVLKNLSIKINGRSLTFNIKDFLMRDSDITIGGKYSLEPNENIVLEDLKITSKLINLDDITDVTQALDKALPKPSASSGNKSGNQNIPVVIPNGTVNLRKIKTGNIELTNTLTRLILRNNILHLRNLSTDIFKGNVTGSIDVNLIKLLVATDLKGKNIDIEKALYDAAGMKDALSGTTEFSAKLNIDANATNPEAQMKGINGDITFLAKDGQFGPFGKLENMILAENIRESQFFQTALGGVINSLSTIDTTHFIELDGKITLNNGVCEIEHISSKGNVMNLHILGNFDILKNYADMKVRVKLTSIISNLLGPINAINPVNLMNSAASMNVVTAKAFSLFCETVPENEFAMLPVFDNTYVDKSATKFQLGVRGDAAKPLTLIKSFKWLATKAQFEAAEEYANSLPDPVEGSTATTIEEAIKEAEALKAAQEAEKKTLKYKIKHLIKKDVDVQGE